MTIGYFLKRSFAYLILLVVVVGFFLGLWFVRLYHAQAVLPFHRTHHLGSVVLEVLAWGVTVIAGIWVIWWAIETAFQLAYCPRCAGIRKYPCPKHGAWKEQ